MEEAFLPGMKPAELMDGDDWLAKEIEVRELFTPTQPVNESDLFVGRKSQFEKLIDTIFQAGSHAIVYGDRGVGKTSLIKALVQRVFAKSRRTRFFDVQCFDGDDFVSIWERAFKHHQSKAGDYTVDEIDDTFTPELLLELANRFTVERPVFIFDEFDRIDDGETKLKMAETIKLFSDRSDEATIILVGVGRTIRDLLQQHESVKRALKQVEMPRMSAQESREIITVRLSRLGMTMDQQTLDAIVWLARGMPSYVHLMAKFSALRAIQNRSLAIDYEAFSASLQICLEEAGESTRQLYALATQSPQPKNRLQETLVACAIAESDEFGRFKAAAIREPLSQIQGRERDIPDFSRHLADFCSEDRGPILEKEGSHKNYRYRFKDPMIQCFVIMRGLKDGMLTMN